MSISPLLDFCYGTMNAGNDGMGVRNLAAKLGNRVMGARDTAVNVGNDAMGI